MNVKKHFYTYFNYLIMKQIVLFISLFSLLIFSIKAQPPGGMPKGMNFNIGKVYGKMLDKASKKPLSYASIAIYAPIMGKDSLINGALSEENGDFSIGELPVGKLTIKISMLGYKEITRTETLSMPDNLEVDLGNIAMEVEEMKTGDVVITAEKAMVGIGIDKRVYNVDKNLTAAGGTAEDVLKSVPSVTVDPDGNAQLRNNAATIYIDGRPTQLTINQIPAAMIEQVEVMTNPSAKYDAGITGGMINIVMKKNKKPGYNGFVAGGIGTGNRYNGTLNLNIKQGRFNVTTFYNGNKNGFPIKGYTHKTNLDASGNPSGYFNQENASTFNNSMQMGRLAIDYSVNNRNTLTIAGNIAKGRFNVGDVQGFSFLDANKKETSSGERSISPDNHFINYTTQATWKKAFPKKGREWTTDAIYSFGNRDNKSLWSTLNYDENGVLVSTNPDITKIDGGSKGNQITFQSDFVNPIKENARLEFGAKVFIEHQAQKMDVKMVLPDTTISLPFVSQDITTKNSIYAAYINYAGTWKSLGYQAGLRYEQTTFSGINNPDSTNFGYSFPKGTTDIWKALFPAIYLSKKLGETSELQFNVTRKINRPGFMQIMPVIFMADRQNVRQGNPKLQPEFINTAEVNYSKIFGNSNILSSLYYRLEENPIVNIAYQAPYDSSILINTFTNGNLVHRYGWDNTFKTNIGKSWELTANANVFSLRVITNDYNRQGWAANGKLIVNYKLPDGASIKLKGKPFIKFSTQLMGNYESRQIMPQGYRKAVPFADFAFKAEAFKVASLTFSVNDMFNTRRMVWVYEQPTYLQEMMRRRDARYFKVSLQFMFGKPDASIFKKSKNMKNMPQGGGMEMY